MNDMTTPATSRSRTRRHTPAVAVLLVAGLVLTGCGDDEPEEATATPTPPASSTPSGSPSPTPTPTPSETPDRSFSDVTPVYYAIDTRAGLRLAREPRTTGEDGIGAVEAMISGPQDPDYSTTWNPGTEVLGVTETDGVITVDLSAEARDANVGSPGAALMVQQLVWTVTELYGDDLSVELLIEGEPAGELWGAATWDEPIMREPGDDIRAFVGIDNPAEGETVKRRVTVTGEAIAFEGTVPWRVLDEQGKEVRSGFTTSEEGMTLAAYTFKVKLAPGTWTIEVSEDDPSGGEGGEPLRDTRTVTVQ